MEGLFRRQCRWLTLTGSIQRLPEVAQQIVRMLDADGQPHIARGHPRRGLVMLAGKIQKHTGSFVFAWSLAFGAAELLAGKYKKEVKL